MRGRTSSALRRCEQTRSAITLIEILTVFAIIALLVGILLPSLSGARRQSTRVRCLSNLHSLAATAAAYAGEDKRNLIVPAHPISDTNPLHDEGLFDYGGADGADDLWGGTRYAPGSARAASTRPLNAYLLAGASALDDYSLFRCPDDRPLPAEARDSDDRFWSPAMHEQSMFESVGTSYAANAYRAHGDDQGKSSYFSVGPFLRPAAMIPAPGDSVLLHEAVMWYNVLFVPGGGPRSFLWRGLPGWHDQRPRYAVAFADGHADSLIVPTGRLAEGVGDPEYGTLWLRGRGFQFDCRPSPPLFDLPAEAVAPQGTARR